MAPLLFAPIVLLRVGVSLAESDLSYIERTQVESWFKQADADSDGFLNYAEALKFSEKIHLRNHGADLHSSFHNIDFDTDGKVTLEEYFADLDLPPSNEAEGEDAIEKRIRELEVERFRLADKNGDGTLSQEEVSGLSNSELEGKIYAHHAELTIKKFDRNADGKLAKEEYPQDQYPEKHDGNTGNFLEYDTNKDGFLDKAEIAHMDSGKHEHEQALQEFIRIIDTNKDHKLSVDEVVAARDNLQINKNGKLADILHEWSLHDEL